MAPDQGPESRDQSDDPAAAAASSTEQEEARVEQDFKDLLADVERQRDEYLDLARRTKADFENYRKRVAGEAAGAQSRGRADVVRQLLPVLDNLERALTTAGETVAPSFLVEGVRLVYEELRGILRRSGVESYAPEGESFDPEWHEAMMTRPAAPSQAGRVLEVLEKGYRQDGQVLRPARVIVGKEEEAVPSTDDEPTG